MSVTRKLNGCLLLPLIYVATAIVMDLTMFAILGLDTPAYFFFSILLLVGVALLTSCIPSRITQLLIFTALVAFQLATTVGNLIAYFNLDEIFMIEMLAVIDKILVGADVAKYTGAWHFTSLGLITGVFLCGAITATVLLRKTRPGYSWRGLACTVVAGVLAISSIYGSLGIMNNNKSLTNFDRITSPSYSISNFTNRTMALFSFGSAMFYFANIQQLLGIKSMAADTVSANIDLGEDDIAEYKYKLGTDKNILMIMLETFEFDAINQYLTPNLWALRNQSTWVDGYYAVERTHTTEYVSLNGSYVLGAEVWRDYTNVELPQSLPNVFRRSWNADNTVDTFQIGGFHNFLREMYNRDQIFTPQRNGMDFIKTPESYPDAAITPQWDLRLNSDTEFVTAAIDDIIPDNVDRFFSYFLPISPHANHFDSPFPTDTTGPFADSRADVLDDTDGTLTGLEYYKTIYPKLNASKKDLAHGVYAYLIGLKETDRAIGMILDKLRTNGTAGKPHNMDDTAIVVYSDHFNYPAYSNEIFNNRGGLLTNTTDELPTGEKINFILYNPTDKVERKITTFMANTDVYKTVAHLFNIKTNNNFTLGASVLDRIEISNDGTTYTQKDWADYDISAGMGIVTGVFFGLDLDTPGVHFSTRDYKKYSVMGGTLSETSKMAYRNRMEQYASTFLKLHSYYDGNKLRNDPRLKYVIEP